jgi:hypothetical protein
LEKYIADDQELVIMYPEPWKALIIGVVKINSDPDIVNQIKNMGLEYLLEIMSIGPRASPNMCASKP